MGAAEKGVGGAAHPHAARLGSVDQLARLGNLDAERLLGVHMLAGRDRLEADLDMGLRDGEVDDDLDAWVGEEIGDASSRQAELGGTGFGDRLVHVGEGTHLEDRESARRLEIGGADIAAADDADADPIQTLLPKAVLYGGRPRQSVLVVLTTMT